MKRKMFIYGVPQTYGNFERPYGIVGILIEKEMKEALTINKNKKRKFRLRQ